MSEKAAGICYYEWLARSPSVDRRRRARDRAAYARRIREACTNGELALLPEAAIQRICDRLDGLSRRWVDLEVGGSLTLPWSGTAKRKRQPSRASAASLGR